MGDRFYQQQLDSTGQCPGIISTKRRRRVAWTDEKKQQAVNMYLEKEPTPENSTDIVGEIAEELEESVNGVRMILSKAGVYVKKTVATAKSDKPASTRVGKAAAQESLAGAILAATGEAADMEIVNKLTGKACVYLEKVLQQVSDR